MKSILINIYALLFIISGLFSMAYLFLISFEDFPKWTGWIIYPTFFFLFITKDTMFNKIIKENKNIKKNLKIWKQ